MTLQEFQADLRAGIPAEIPAAQPYDPTVNHAPKRKDILTKKEKQLALRNALRYFPASQHAALAPEFVKELHVPFRSLGWYHSFNILIHALVAGKGKVRKTTRAHVPIPFLHIA